MHCSIYQMCLLPAICARRHHVAVRRIRASARHPRVLCSRQSPVWEIQKYTDHEDSKINFFPPWNTTGTANLDHCTDTAAMKQKLNFNAAHENGPLWFMWARSSHKNSPGWDQRQHNCSPGSLVEWGVLFLSHKLLGLPSQHKAPLSLPLYCLNGARIKKGTYASCQSSCQHLSFFSQMLWDQGGQSTPPSQLIFKQGGVVL